MNTGIGKFVLPCELQIVVYSTIVALVLGVTPSPAFAKTTALQDRTYHFSVFAVQSGTATAACSANNCKTSTEMLKTGGNGFEVFCDQPTCTFYAHVESDAQLSAGDTGLFTFVVTDLNDQVVPLTPGPANPDGSVAFLAKEPDATTHYGTSASVLTTVPAGWYVVTVKIGCLDAGGGGCSALSFHSTLSVDIYSN